MNAVVSNRLTVHASTSGRMACAPPRRALSECFGADAAVLPAPCNRRQTSIVCGLKKQQKKLAKALKTHRRRLEQVLNTVPDSISHAALRDIVAELQNMNSHLERLTTYTATMVAVDGSSSGPISDADTRIRSSQLAAELLSQLELPNLDDPAPEYVGTGRVLVCQGSKCQREGALGVLQTVSALTRASDGIDVLPCKCLGKCKQGAAMSVKKEGSRPAVYTQVKPSEVQSMLSSNFETAQSAEVAKFV